MCKSIQDADKESSVKTLMIGCVEDDIEQVCKQGVQILFLTDTPAVPIFVCLPKLFKRFCHPTFTVVIYIACDALILKSYHTFKHVIHRKNLI